MKPLFLICCAVFLIQCNQPKGIQIQGAISGAGNDQIALTQLGAENFKPLEIAKTQADAQGNFTLKSETSIEPGIYQITIGDLKMFSVLTEEDKKIEIAGEKSKLNAFEFTFKNASPAANEFRTFSNMIVTERRELPEIKKAVEGIQDPLCAMSASILLFRGHPDYLDLYKNIAERLKAKYPKSSYNAMMEKVILEGSNQDKLKAQATESWIDKPAPDIKLPDPEGNMLSLSSLRGKVVLLDFWASWCGPCRKSNPKLVEMYHRHKSKGFTIFSVSLDGLPDAEVSNIPPGEQQNLRNKMSKSRWTEAIKADRLDWQYHVSELRKWDSDVARTYGVNSIPRAFLIDKEGIIRAMGSAESMEAKIQELL